jgi:hypothetical protein
MSTLISLFYLNHLKNQVVLMTYVCRKFHSETSPGISIEVMLIKQLIIIEGIGTLIDMQHGWIFVLNYWISS